MPSNYVKKVRPKFMVRDELLTVREIADRYDVDYNTVAYRVKVGYRGEDLLALPAQLGTQTGRPREYTLPPGGYTREELYDIYRYVHPTKDREQLEVLAGLAGLNIDIPIQRRAAVELLKEFQGRLALEREENRRIRRGEHP